MSIDPSSEKSKKIVFTKTKFRVRLNGTKYGSSSTPSKDVIKDKKWNYISYGEDLIGCLEEIGIVLLDLNIRNIFVDKKNGLLILVVFQYVL